jgi:hypothetical protein
MPCRFCDERITGTPEIGGSEAQCLVRRCIIKKAPFCGRFLSAKQNSTEKKTLMSIKYIGMDVHKDTI